MWKESRAMNPAPLFPFHFLIAKVRQKMPGCGQQAWKLSERLCSRAPDASELQAFCWTLETTGSTVRDTTKAERMEK